MLIFVAATYVLLAILASYLLWRFMNAEAAHGTLPPGPKKKPFVGNLYDWPTFHKNWEKFREWQQQYGDIVSASALGRTMVVINSYEVANALLNGRSAIYSDRPDQPMAGDLVGWYQNLGFMRLGERFRAGRSMLHKIMGTRSSAQQFDSLEEGEWRKCLLKTLDDPDNFVQHIRHAAGAIILKITYGYEVQENDPFVAMADRAIRELCECMVPGSFLVDFMPVLKYIPDWFPGAGFKKSAKVWRKNLDQASQRPFNFTKADIANGTAAHSLVQSVLGKEGKFAQDEQLIQGTALAIYMAGSDTTVASIHALFIALALYPETLRRAQAEVDSVVGGLRLPSMSDYEHLPYCRALTKEIFRWHPSVPVGLIHRLTKDDVYDGYFLPAGAAVFANIDAMLHDPRTYCDPYAFDPLRFLPELSGRPAEQDPYTIGFGFGRRICAGLNIADASIFLACATIAATFNVQRPVKNGMPAELVYEKTPGLVSHPKPCKVDISPRSKTAEQLLRGC